jgi:hypothetical protein
MMKILHSRCPKTGDRGWSRSGSTRLSGISRSASVGLIFDNLAVGKSCMKQQRLLRKQWALQFLLSARALEKEKDRYRPMSQSWAQGSLMRSCFRTRGGFSRHGLGGQEQCGQATKGVWGMSWRQKAMKGVENCEKPGEAVKRALIPGFPN